MKEFKILSNFYSNKKVLITGHTGFKGSWLSLMLEELGSKIIGVSKEILKKPSLFQTIKFKNVDTNFCDVSHLKKFKEIIKKEKPDIIFHLAAQSIVSKSYLEPNQTVLSNTLGVLNLLEILRNYKKKCSVVIITSDKCYKNLENKSGYDENSYLGGDDIYSASKAAAENLIYSYNKSFFSKNKNIKISSARAGNVVGGGDWTADRLVPDIIRNWSNKKIVEIRSPKSIRPWQHVLDPLYGYLILAKKMYLNSNFIGTAYNFGPRNTNKKVIDVLSLMRRYWQNFCNISIKKNKKFNETKILKLKINKAKTDLNWKPNLNFNETIKLTTLWYKKYYLSNPKNLTDFTKKQIREYFSKL